MNSLLREVGDVVRFFCINSVLPVLIALPCQPD